MTIGLKLPDTAMRNTTTSECARVCCFDNICPLLTVPSLICRSKRHRSEIGIRSTASGTGSPGVHWPYRGSPSGLSALTMPSILFLMSVISTTFSAVDKGNFISFVILLVSCIKFSFALPAISAHNSSCGFEQVKIIALATIDTTAPLISTWKGYLSIKSSK